MDGHILPVVFVAANQVCEQKRGAEQQKPHQNMMAAMNAIAFTLHHNAMFDCKSEKRGIYGGEWMELWRKQKYMYI